MPLIAENTKKQSTELKELFGRHNLKVKTYETDSNENIRLGTLVIVSGNITPPTKQIEDEYHALTGRRIRIAHMAFVIHGF